MIKIYHGGPPLPDRILLGRVFLFVSALPTKASGNGFRGLVNHLPGCHFIQCTLSRRRNSFAKQGTTLFFTEAT